MIDLYVKGDLLKAFQESEFDAIVHGCNCFHMMGAGIAGQIAKIFPESLKIDKKYSEYGDWGKLGSYTVCGTTYGHIINGYTQFRPGRCPEHDLMYSIQQLFFTLNEKYSGKTIGIPMIGCGIAGGNWQHVSKLINEITPDLKIIVYYFE